MEKNFKGEIFQWLYLEGEELDIMLDSGVRPVTTNETLGIKDCVLRVGGKLVLSSITNQSLIVSSESNIRWSNTVALVIRNDFYSTVLEHTHTAKKESHNTIS